MNSDALSSDLAQAGGWTTVAGSAVMAIVEWFSTITINDFLQGIMLVGSLIFLYYKIQSQKLNVQNQKMDMEIKRKTFEESSKDKEDVEKH